MPLQRPHAVASLRLPDSERLVARCRDQLVALREKADGRHVVVVAVEGFRAAIRRSIPKFDCEIRRARGYRDKLCIPRDRRTH